MRVFRARESKRWLLLWAGERVLFSESTRLGSLCHAGVSDAKNPNNELPSQVHDMAGYVLDRSLAKGSRSQIAGPTLTTAYNKSVKT